MTILTWLEVEEQAAYDRGIGVEYVAPGDERLEGRPARTVWTLRRISILINRRLLNREKLELLLHERGHIETHNARHKRSDAASELKAWAWAYEYYLPEKRLTEAAERFYLNDELDVNALAEHFDITPRFILGALEFYRYAAIYRAPEPALRVL